MARAAGDHTPSAATRRRFPDGTLGPEPGTFFGPVGEYG